MNFPDLIFENLVSVFCVKNTYAYAYTFMRIRIRDLVNPGSGIIIPDSQLCMTAPEMCHNCTRAVQPSVPKIFVRGQKPLNCLLANIIYQNEKKYFD